VREKASSENLEEYVRTIAADFVPRDFEHEDNLRRTAEYIRLHLAGRGRAVVRDQPFEARGATYRNVCGLIGPEGRGRVVVGAHYDAAGPYPGADDNASGVAGLLELARIFGADPPEIAVELVAYCLEEPPFFYSHQMGSYVHASSLRRDGIEVKSMISLEMIGYFRDEPGSQRFPLSVLRPFYPSEGNFIAVVGKLFDRRLARRIRNAMRGASPLAVYSLNAPSIVPGVALSDHLSYWRNRYPAVMITDTAMFRNPHYHLPSDTPDTLDYRRMAMVVDGVAAAIRTLAR